MMNANSNQVRGALATVQRVIADALRHDGIAILPPADVRDTLRLAALLRAPFSTVVLDPWYNKGVGGVREDYLPYILGIMEQAKEVARHTYLWGFPEILAPFIGRIPQPLALVSWLAWYFKNNPSVIRGWRSAQMTCLHLSHPGAKLYVEHFLNEAQLEKLADGKLRYMPGPPSVIEESLLVGFVGRKEQTGHPSQKPVKVIRQLLMMTTTEGDLVLDPMSGSGTTAEAARGLGRCAVICDHSEEYTQIAEKRLGLQRLDIAGVIDATLAAQPAEDAVTWPDVEQVRRQDVGPAPKASASARQMAFFEKHVGGDGAGKAPGARTKRSCAKGGS